jgi:uncharacterized protein
MSRRVAIVGSGVAGLSAAHHLRGEAEVTLFESAHYLGGHAHTVEVTLPSRSGPITHGVDTGFLVFNERTYPGLIALFEALGVSTAKSDMSFSVQIPRARGRGALEWNGATLNTVFAQRVNLLRPRFWWMLREVLRFNRLATALAQDGDALALAQPLGAFLSEQRFGASFTHWYLLPMLGCIWSCPTDQMLQFPVGTMVRFCHNHGLIQVNNRPQWWTVSGGSKHYVQKIAAGIDHVYLNAPVGRIERDAQGVTLWVAGQAQRFDQVVIAGHADQALAMLDQPTAAEREVLGAFRFQDNEAVLHTDTRVMPKARRAWAAWNYERASDSEQEQARVCLHYWLNALQPLPFEQDVVVSLNPTQGIDSAHVLGRYTYAHPVFDAAAIAAQEAMPTLQGHGGVWFAGAWMGYGFHEDGFQAGRAAALGVLRA